MIPDPLHPAMVHFPIVLGLLVPIFAATAFWGIYVGRLPRRSWIGILAIQLALVSVTWVAVETGEEEEERVERVVAERHIEAHEANAERFLLLAALGVPLAAAGLMGGTLGAVNRALAIALSLAAVGAAASTGHSGGELVYRHGAATAYAQPAGIEGAGTPRDYAGDYAGYAADDDDEDDDD